MGYLCCVPGYKSNYKKDKPNFICKLFFMTTDVVVRSGFLLLLCDFLNIMRTFIHYMLCNHLIYYELNIIYIYIYYRFIVRFPIGCDFFFITYCLHLFLSLTSSL